MARTGKRMVYGEMLVWRGKSGHKAVEVSLQGVVRPAERGVGLMESYVDDVQAFDENGREVKLTDGELWRAGALLANQLEAA